MSGKYNKQKSNDSLINIISSEDTYHTEHPKPSVVDLFQTGFLEAVRKYGVNVQLVPADIYEIIGDQSSSFHDNFCGGINGIISYGEKEILNRFTEAIGKAGDNFDDKLKKGFETFISSDPHSKHNAYDGQRFDMKIRTRFCVEICRPKYWQILIEPLLPDIDGYISEHYPKWGLMPENEKIFVHKLSADALREIAEKITGKNIPNIFERSRYIKQYANVFKKQILAMAWCMFDQEDRNKTMFGGYMT